MAKSEEIKKIKLIQLNEKELSEKELNHLLGGGSSCCMCGCVGTSSSFSNSDANQANGLSSPGGGGASGSYN